MVKMARQLKAKRALSALRKVRKDVGLKKKRTVVRRDATVVLAQGALATPKRNFGSAKRRGRKSASALMKMLDARIPHTLGLPRAVGPYQVIRTTKLHRSDSSFIMFCPCVQENSSSHSGDWLDICGIEDVDSTLGVTAALNARPIMMPMQGLAAACEVVPAGLTVQVMNPASLQTADGIFAMTRVNQQLMLGTQPSTVTWDEMAARVIAFYSPRILTGGKLALRGVQCSAYPLDMSEYADFLPVRVLDHDFTWGPAVRPSALSPIVFVQNNDVPKTVEFMVTIEWRVRFDPGNPATSSHTYHETLSDEAWNGVIKAASAVGHGVEEISEDVAALGVARYAGILPFL